MINDFKLAAVVAIIKKLLPVVIGAVGGFVAGTYPETFQAFCAGGL